MMVRPIRCYHHPLDDLVVNTLRLVSRRTQDKILKDHKRRDHEGLPGDSIFTSWLTDPWTRPDYRPTMRTSIDLTLSIRVLTGVLSALSIRHRVETLPFGIIHVQLRDIDVRLKFYAHTFQTMVTPQWFTRTPIWDPDYNGGCWRVIFEVDETYPVFNWVMASLKQPELKPLIDQQIEERVTRLNLGYKKPYSPIV